MGAALMLLLRGFPDQAARQVEQALALARRLLHPPSLGTPCGWRGKPAPRTRCYRPRRDPARPPARSTAQSSTAIATMLRVGAGHGRKRG